MARELALRITVDGAGQARRELADTEKAVKGVEGAGKKAGAGLTQLEGGFKKVSPAAGAARIAADLLTSTIVRFAGTAAIGAAIAGSIKYAGTLQDMAVKTGIGTSSLQRLERAAKENGNTIDQLTVGMGRFGARLAGGSASVLSGLRQLGLRFDDIRAAEPEEQLLLISDRLKDIQDPATRARVAMELFGQSGIELLPTLASDMRAVAEGAPVMSESTVAALAAIDDAWERTKADVKVAAAEITAALLAVAQEVAAITSGRLSPTLEGILNTTQGPGAPSPGLPVAAPFEPISAGIAQAIAAIDTGTASIERFLALQDRLFGRDVIARADELVTAIGDVNNVTRLTPESFHMASEAMREAEAILRQNGETATAAGQRILGMLNALRAAASVPPESYIVPIGTFFEGQVGTALNAQEELGALLPAMSQQMYDEMFQQQQQASAENAALIESLAPVMSSTASEITATNAQMTTTMSADWRAWGSVAAGTFDQVKSAAQRAFEFLQRNEEMVRAYREAGVFVNELSFASAGYDAAIRRQAGGYTGFAHGGVSDRPAIFGEGGEPEIAGSVSFMARVLRMAQTGSGGYSTGTGQVFNVTINAETREGGREAARGFAEELKRRGVRISA